MQQFFHNIVSIVPMLCSILRAYISMSRPVAFGAANFKVCHKVDDHFGSATTTAFSGQQMVVHITMIEIHFVTSYFDDTSILYLASVNPCS
jgi:hypothetical protein